MTTLAIIGIIAAVVIALPALWCAVLLALSYAGGWHALAASYGAREPPHGTQFTGESGFVGGVSYRGTLTVHVASEGLFLSVPAFFRIGHRTLLIPWNEINNPKAVKFLWHEAINFQVGSPPVSNLSLSPEIFEARKTSATLR